MTPTTPTKGKYQGLVRVDAKEPIPFRIDQDCIERGIPKTNDRCVIALAAKKAYGPMFERIEIGVKITKIYTQDRVIRCNTPWVLQQAIPHYDRTGEWTPPPGDYEFKPFKNPNRHNTITRGQGPRGPGKITVFRPRRAHTRTITRLSAV